MATLLSIPEELRDQILEILLLSHRPIPPTHPSPSHPRQDPHILTRSSVRSSVRSWNTTSVLYETHSPTPTATPLLLTNRTLHAQTRRVLARLYPHGPIYTLDVLFLNECLLIPTWLHIPSFSRHIHRVDVTFRIHGSSHDDVRRGYVGFRSGDGAPPALTWAFYFLLEHFLDHGPVALRADQTPRCGPTAGLSVHEIRLDFLSSGACQDDTPESHRFWQIHHGRGHNCEAPLPCLPMHPSWLAKFVRGFLPAMLVMSYHTAPYADIVLERVNLFTFIPLGGLEYHVRRYLAQAQVHTAPTPGRRGGEGEGEGWWYTDATFGHLAPGCRVLTFWNWKFRAVERRRARGLEGVEGEGQVIWPTAGELERVRRHRRRSQWGEAGAEKEMMTCNEEGARCMCAETRLEEWLRRRELEGGGLRDESNWRERG